MFQVSGAALLLIDVQTPFIERSDDTGGLVPAAQAVIQILEDVRRTQAMPVLHIAMHEKALSTALRYEDQTRLLKENFNLNFYPDYKPQGHEALLTKSRYSAFSNPGLEQELEGHEVKHLYLGGFHTSACLEESGLDGLRKGYQVSVIKGATSSPNSQRTNEGLENIRAAGGEIIEVADFRKLIYPKNPLYPHTINPHCVLV